MAILIFRKLYILYALLYNNFDVFYMHPDEEDVYHNHGGKGTLIPVHDGDVIELGDRPLKIISIPGHTPGSIAILDIRHRFLISGDSIQDGNIFMFKGHRNMARYAESMRKIMDFMGEFDEIYPSHGSFPVHNDLIPKLLQGATDILEGLASGNVIDLFGNQVMLYKFPYAGFLCDLPKQS